MTTGKKLANVLIISVLIFWGCSKRNESVLDKIDMDTFIVSVSNPSRRTIQEMITLSGAVKALDEAQLFPRTDGKIIKNVLKEGEAVRKDQAVVLVKRDDVGAVYAPAPVPSTINGVVAKIYLDPGATVSPSTPVALVVNQKQVRVAVSIPEIYAGKIFLGQDAAVQVTAYPQAVFAGKIYKISPVLDTESRTIQAEILINNPKGFLKSGMFADIKIITARKDEVYAVPNSAVLNEDGKSYIFTLKDGSLSKKEIRTGIKDLHYVEVSAGIGGGENIVISNLYGLKDGSKAKTADNTEE